MTNRVALCDKFLPYDEYRPGLRFDAELENFPMTGLRLVGLISFLNSPKASVPNAVMKCRNAGIKVVLMTGDNSVNATTIARIVGIIADENHIEEEVIGEKTDFNLEDDRSGKGYSIRIVM